jgi:hypothetical protein
MDCDVLVTKNIEKIYNMDMHWKAIAWWHDVPIREHLKKWYFWINNYINAGVILFDTKKYNVKKINVKNIEEINKKYWNWINDSDQDYLNLIFKDDIFIYNQTMNYLIENKYFNKWLKDASIIHCLQKPYSKKDNIPQVLRDLYFSYLKKTKWKDYQLEWDKENITWKLYLFTIFFVKRFFWKKAQIYLQIILSKLRKWTEKCINFKKK